MYLVCSIPSRACSSAATCMIWPLDFHKSPVAGMNINTVNIMWLPSCKNIANSSLNNLKFIAQTTKIKFDICQK